MRVLHRVLVSTCLIGAGLVVGRLSVADSQVGARAERGQPEHARMVESTSSDHQPQQDFRAILRDELRSVDQRLSALEQQGPAQPGSDPVARPAQPDGNEPQPLTQDGLANIEPSLEVVASALVEGHWTRDHMERLHQEMDHLSRDEQFETMRRLSVAINDGRINVEDGALF